MATEWLVWCGAAAALTAMGATAHWGATVAAFAVVAAGGRLVRPSSILQYVQLRMLPTTSRPQPGQRTRSTPDEGGLELTLRTYGESPRATYSSDGHATNPRLGRAK